MENWEPSTEHAETADAYGWKTYWFFGAATWGRVDVVHALLASAVHVGCRIGGGCSVLNWRNRMLWSWQSRKERRDIEVNLERKSLGCPTGGDLEVAGGRRDLAIQERSNGRSCACLRRRRIEDGLWSFFKSVVMLMNLEDSPGGWHIDLGMCVQHHVFLPDVANLHAWLNPIHVKLYRRQRRRCGTAR